MIFEEDDVDLDPPRRAVPCWGKASDKALYSFSRLSHKKCLQSLSKYQRNKIDSVDLYNEVVQSITEAANLCIPKFNPGKEPKRHDLPMWKERMTTYKDDVDYWLQLPFLHSGPNKCPDVVTHHLRLAKSRYRRQVRQLW